MKVRYSFFVFIIMALLITVDCVAQSTNEVKLIKNGGVYEVPVVLNNVLAIHFIIDSGASDVSISPDVALTLIRTKTITNEDWLPGAYYKFADGTTAKSQRFKLKLVKIGNVELTNVTCSISNSLEAPMLLGQSALQKLGRYSIDYDKMVITFNTNKSGTVADDYSGTLGQSETNSDGQYKPTEGNWGKKVNALWDGKKYTNPKKAIEYLNNVIKLKPKEVSAYYNRGVAYDNLGQYQRAIEDYNYAIRLQPDLAQAYNNRAVIYLNQGNKKQGCLDAQKTCELGNCLLLDMAKDKGYCQ